MQRERERSRKLNSPIQSRTSRTYPCALRVTSVIVMIVFSVFPLFSCHQDKIGNSTETADTFSGEFAVSSDSVLAPADDLPVRPISGRIVAFRGIPTAVVIQRVYPSKLRNISQNDSLLSKGLGVVTITTSEGKQVRGVVRQLITTWDGLCTGSGDRRDDGGGGAGGFPWAESDIIMQESSGYLHSIEGGMLQLFLVIEDGGELASGLARIGDKTVSVDLENPPDVPVLHFDDNKDEDQREDADRYALPDPHSPLDAFRRLIMSGNTSTPLHAEGTAPRGETLPEILSRQNAARLSLGLNRLRRVSPSAADSLMEVLTRRCRDGRTVFAAWLVFPPDLADLDFLLSREVNDNRAEDWASSILAWVDHHPEVISWIESSQDEQVRVVLANLTGVSQKREIALVSQHSSVEGKHVVIPAGTVYRTQLIRTKKAALTGVSDVGDGINETGEAIVVRNRNRIEQRILLQPSQLQAIPPFASLGPTVEMWRVDSWVRRDILTTPPNRQTTAQLSFQNGHWRMRFDCRTPVSIGGKVSNKLSGKGEMNGRESHPQSSVDDFENDEHEKNHNEDRPIPTDIDELSGREAITVYVGSYSRPRCIVSLMPDGQLLIWDSDRKINEKLLQDEFKMNTSSNDHSWSVAFNLPDWWLEDGGSKIEVGYIRTHEETRVGDCYPYPCLPWRLNPGRVSVDLSLWNP